MHPGPSTRRAFSDNRKAFQQTFGELCAADCLSPKNLHVLLGLSGPVDRSGRLNRCIAGLRLTFNTRGIHFLETDRGSARLTMDGGSRVHYE